jgi:hypothetical protein
MSNLPNKCGYVSGPNVSAEVNDYIDRAQWYSSGAYRQSIDFLDGLARFVPNAVGPISDVGLDGLSCDVKDPNFDIIPRPERFVPDPVIPLLPDPFDFGDIHQINPGPIPEFNIPDPDLQPITVPDPLSARPPGDAPVIRTDFDYPEDLGEIVLPDVPPFHELDIPPPFEYNFPDFAEIPPEYLGPPPPSLTFNWDEDPYDSELIRAVTAELLDRVVNGGTGLHPLVEQAIWERARNREDVLSMKARMEVLTASATRGFFRPSGSTVAALDMLAQANQSKQADLSREIAIKQAELEQENLKFSIQQSIALEQMMINQYNSALTRAFEAQKFIQQAAVEIFNFIRLMLSYSRPN